MNSARHYVSMATCLDTVNVNNQGFGVCFCNKKLNIIINDSDSVMLGLDLLIFGSNCAKLSARYLSLRVEGWNNEGLVPPRSVLSIYYTSRRQRLYLQHCPALRRTGE